MQEITRMELCLRCVAEPALVVIVSQEADAAEVEALAVHHVQRCERRRCFSARDAYWGQAHKVAPIRQLQTLHGLDIVQADDAAIGAGRRAGRDQQAVVVQNHFSRLPTIGRAAFAGRFGIPLRDRPGRGFEQLQEDLVTAVRFLIRTPLQLELRHFTGGRRQLPAADNPTARWHRQSAG